ncbi:zinc ribbon domain-containing protein [Bacillus glycinifermentans]|uniref:Zinc ribbon domain-containing protein n=1 Tax=Bacillus glycinifermentans TaxID=1664069 RepID=A0A0T6BIR2_9BACI|nr:zinc ribbon domain-containing protein [Bacillus glycinifermentans]ATH93232.1 zinc ribbon domain-containing protein [Bacillus glycinifermentans]KRT88392.1 hypothetical protein AB447_208325 [Bacillus glycinifermentans]MEC0483295.1 zinc ribbon domain-containing protein [Bacillus glycinifermentans]MEC0493717.1 zinc ribbon domain-containing protein [Bacillus glycinifermentans]MEC0541938.1 zinc ribbon domain-containing protein [Bacillus glycinifermentans]
MNFCKACGRELAGQAQFCKHCGTPVNGRQADAEEPVNQDPVHKRKISRKSMMIWAGIAAVCVLLFAGYKTGEALTSKEKLIGDFESALKQNDEKKVAALLHSSDVDLTITKQNVKPLMTYLDDHPDEKKDLISSLKDQSGDGLVSIEKAGKQFLIYDRYVLNVKPVYLTVKASEKGAGLYINNKKVMTTEKENFEKKFGPFVPGSYDVEAKLNSDIGELKKSKHINALDEDASADVSLDAQKAKLVFDDGYDKLKGTLWINGQKVKINPFQGTSFGPVLTDGSMSASVEAEFPWGNLKSEKTPIDGAEIKVNLASDQGFMNMIMNTVVQNTKETMKAFANGSVNGMTVAAPSFKSDLKEIVGGMKSSNTYYKGTYLSTAFDLDSFRLYHEGGKWKADVSGIEKHKSAYYDDYSAPDLAENENGYTYTLVYAEDEKKWLVEKSDSALVYIKNKKEIKDENPKQYTSAWASAKGTSKNVPAGGELTDQKVTQAIEGYVYDLQNAVNGNDFELVADDLKEGSQLYADQKALVAKLNHSGTKEEVADVSVKSWSQDGSDVTIKTLEKINIIKNGKEQLKTYNWTYHAVVEDGELLLTSIE